MAEADRDLAGVTELLRDLGRSGSRCVYSDDRDDELMRLSAAPLMIRDFLRRQKSCGEEIPPRLSDIPPGASLFLQLERDQPRHAALGAMYVQDERRLEPSLIPEAFQPSAADRSEAISDQLTAVWKWRLSGLMRRLTVLIGMILILSLLHALI